MFNKALFIFTFILLQSCSAASHHKPIDDHRRAIGAHHNKHSFVSPQKIFVPRRKLSRKTSAIILGVIFVALIIDAVQSPAFSQEACFTDGPCTTQITRLQKQVCPPPTLPCKKLACEIGLFSQKVITPHEQYFSSPETIKSKKIKKHQIQTPIGQDDYRTTLAWVERDLLPLDLLSQSISDLSYYVRQTSWILNNKKLSCAIRKSTPSNVPDFSNIKNMHLYLQNYDVRSVHIYEELTETFIENKKRSSGAVTWDNIIKDILHKKIDPYYDFVKRYYDHNNLFRTPTESVLETFEIIKKLFEYKPITCAALIHQAIFYIHTETPNPFADTNGHTARIWMNILLKQAGYPGIAIHNESAYLKASREAFEQGRINIFEDYIKKEICKVTKTPLS